jgi:hypothetical protein
MDSLRGSLRIWITLLLPLLAVSLLAPGRADGQAAAPPPSTTAAVVSAATVELGGFRGIRLGMSVDEVKAQLAKEPLFSYHGDRDVSLLPASRQILIEVPGRTFVERGYFQFHDGKLLIMIVLLAREQVSYFEVYTQLSSRYGPTSALDPAQAVWELPGTRLALEKPVVLKYVDSAAFQSLRDESRLGTDYELLTRRQFLESL